MGMTFRHCWCRLTLRWLQNEPTGQHVKLTEITSRNGDDKPTCRPVEGTYGGFTVDDPVRTGWGHIHYGFTIHLDSGDVHSDNINGFDSFGTK